MSRSTKRVKKKYKYNKSIKNKTRRIHPSSNAGDSIAAGGFGCVFKPPINCDKYPNKRKYDKSYISKLMLNKYAYDEIDLIDKFLPHIKKIKNFEKYFLINDIYMCQPTHLSASDLHSFNKVCTNFKQYDSDDVNKNINDFKIINAPDGGIDLDIYWNKWNKINNKNKNKYKLFAINNICLINLLNKGIKEMNNVNIYHLDIKGSNILHSSDNNKNIQNIKNITVKIIDWGLAIYKSSSSSFPSKIFGRPLQYNLPFSNILLHNRIQNDIDRNVEVYLYLTNKTKKTRNKSDICKYLSEKIYEETNKYLGLGHQTFILDTLRKIYSTVTRNLHLHNYNIGKNIIINYNKTVLENFLDDNYIFNIKDYINKVYLKNVDIWGFLISYLDVIPQNNRLPKNTFSNELKYSIFKILVKYCFSKTYSIKAISINDVKNDLIKLNSIVKQPSKIGQYKIL